MRNEAVRINDTLSKEIIHWGCDYLLSHGYTLKSHLPEDVQHTPWSYVVRFATSSGYIYLKQTPKLLALEATITQMLHAQFGACVPEIVAHSVKLHGFLMKDAGRPLRDLLRKQFDAALLCNAIEQFTALQLSVVEHNTLFLDRGVPDWRLDKLPVLYQHLLSQKALLREDGLSELELSQLERLLPKVCYMCQTLTDYAIKPTIVQCDFHDNNILIDATRQHITFIDLGEIVISHPFFSLVSCLRQVTFHHGLTDEDEAYAQLMQACLNNPMTFESKKPLSDAFALAQRLWFVYDALAQYRLMLACDQARFKSFQRHGKLSGRLKEVIIACSTTD